MALLATRDIRLDKRNYGMRERRKGKSWQAGKNMAFTYHSVCLSFDARCNQVFASRRGANTICISSGHLSIRLNIPAHTPEDEPY